jgi:hypothetical protein
LAAAEGTECTRLLGAETQPHLLLRTIRHEGEYWINAGATNLDCVF